MPIGQEYSFEMGMLPSRCCWPSDADRRAFSGADAALKPPMPGCLPATAYSTDMQLMISLSEYARNYEIKSDPLMEEVLLRRVACVQPVVE